MKCEIKHIKSDMKKDCELLDLKTILILILISFVMSFPINMFLNTLSLPSLIILFLVIIIYPALFCYFGWKDAVEYCKNVKIETLKKDIFNNKIFIEVFASGKPLKAHVLALTRLSDDEVVKSINEIIEENEIAYEDIMPPRSKDKGSYKLSMKTKHLIEEKMEDIGIEIYIFGFLTTTGVGEESC